MARRNRFPASCALLGSATVLIALATTVSGWQAPPPAPVGTTPEPPAPTLSGNLPLAVSIPSGVTTPEQARPFFDTFSWQSFVALNWPAASSWTLLRGAH